jgi:hypothetical protein
MTMTTDVPCTSLGETSVTVGTLDQLETKPPLATSSTCDAMTGKLGTLVLVPSGAKDEEFAVRVVVGIGQSAQSCVDAHYAGNCIVARRTMRFVAGTPLVLPIAMRVDCRGVQCADTDTCAHGACVSPQIPDPNACKTADGCSDTVLGASDAGSDGTAPHDGAPDGDDDAAQHDAAADGAADVVEGTTDGAGAADGADAEVDAADAADAAPLADAAADAGPDADAGPPPPTQCTSTRDCPAGQYCAGAKPANRTTFCVAGPGTAKTGQHCAQNSDCASNYCLPGAGVCSEFCIGNSDCATGTFCVHAPDATLRPFAYECHPTCAHNAQCPGGTCAALYESDGSSYHSVCGLAWGAKTFGDKVNDFNQCDTAYSDITTMGEVCTRYCATAADCTAPLPYCKVVMPPAPPDQICRQLP